MELTEKLRVAILALFQIILQEGFVAAQFPPSCSETFLPSRADVKFAKFLTDAARSCLKNYHTLFEYIQSSELDSRNYTAPKLLFYNVENWDLLCRHWHSTSVCIQSSRPECDISWAKRHMSLRTFVSKSSPLKYPSPLYAYGERNCNETFVKQFVAQLYQHSLYNPSCLTINEWNKLSSCTSGSREVNDFVKQAQQSANPKSIKSTLDRVAANALRCARNVITTSSCNMITSALLFHTAKLQLPAVYAAPDVNLIQNALVVLDKSKKCIIGAFTLHSTFLIHCGTANGRVNCFAPGRAIYLSNDFIEVIGIGKIVDVGGGRRNQATKIQSLQIAIKSLDGKRIVAYFDPALSRETVLGTGKETVNVLRQRGRIVLDQKATGMRMIIRALSDTISFTIQIPEATVLQSHGLLATGCPPNQIRY